MKIKKMISLFLVLIVLLAACSQTSDQNVNDAVDNTTDMLEESSEVAETSNWDEIQETIDNYKYNEFIPFDENLD